MKGHHTPIQHNKCAHKFHCQRALYVGPCAHRINNRSPVACSSSSSGNLWRTTSRVLQDTYLSVQLECLYCGNFHKDCGWAGCPCQPSATSSPPIQDFQRVKPQTPKGMGLGGPGPPRSPKMDRIRAEAGQRITAQMGAPVSTQ